MSRVGGRCFPVFAFKLREALAINANAAPECAALRHSPRLLIFARRLLSCHVTPRASIRQTEAGADRTCPPYARRWERACERRLLPQKSSRPAHESTRSSAGQRRTEAATASAQARGHELPSGRDARPSAAGVSCKASPALLCLQQRSYKPFP